MYSSDSPDCAMVGTTRQKRRRVHTGYMSSASLVRTAPARLRGVRSEVLAVLPARHPDETPRHDFDVSSASSRRGDWINFCGSRQGTSVSRSLRAGRSSGEKEPGSLPPRGLRRTNIQTAAGSHRTGRGSSAHAMRRPPCGSSAPAVDGLGAVPNRLLASLPEPCRSSPRTRSAYLTHGG